VRLWACDTSVKLRHRDFVLPTQAQVDRQTRVHPEVICEVRVEIAGPEVLVGIPVRERARVGEPKQEVCKIVPCEGAIEGKAAAGILLRHEIHERESAVAAEAERVPAFGPARFGADVMVLGTVERIDAIAQTCDTAGERETRRPPVRGILVVALDARIPRYVGAEREV